MPVIAILIFIICVVLLVLLMNGLANRKKIKAAYAYGQENFDIELPKTAAVNNGGFHKLSDEAAFFTLVIPYLPSLNKDKREKVKDQINKLKSDLKISPDLHQKVIDAYDTE